ncbi:MULTISPECIES: sigma-70 family RNA polymerase sigma factor [Leptolyngbya]|uniref:sigma-70 family RNA polymerase sigma factor n=1 Tax=Leptolyngbya TaxID=47251 RepID=UPI00168714E8|nr:sigma-70 family RNA polymerase sigma factor [Leptolyngbya sp. FACHB-1624]MBD1857749.1 sigma-70 family RNA polymerase sigma factor [Leptolyngbya sp. FACHB-1624]
MDTLKVYLEQIGRIPRLTPEQEIELGRQVQGLQKLYEVRQSTLEQWEKAVNLSHEELQSAIARGEHAKRQMIEANLRLVVSIAQTYQNRGLDLSDLIQEGNLGLQRSVEKFDPSKGYRFSTYAYWWIRQAMSRAIALKSRTIRIPTHLTEKLNLIQKTQRSLSQTLGRTATISEIAQALSSDATEIRETLLSVHRSVSLDLPVGRDQDTKLGELLPDEGEMLEEKVTRSLLREDLFNLLGLLPANQRQVMTLRFGLEDGEALSLSQASRKMNCSRETVRLLEKAAMKTLQQYKVRLQEYVAV